MTDPSTRAGKESISAHFRAARALFVAGSALLILAPRVGHADPEAPNPEASEAADLGASITPPRILRFTPAEYPEEARRQRLEGEVVLTLTIDENGHVQDVSVHTVAGSGSDEAASAAALQFMFAPAERAGKPIASRILARARRPGPLSTQTLRG